MNDKQEQGPDTPIAEARLEWVRPQVDRMSAGEAEAGSGVVTEFNTGSS